MLAARHSWRVPYTSRAGIETLRLARAPRNQDYVDSPPSPRAPVHFRGDGYPDRYPRRCRYRYHARGYLSLYRYSSRERPVGIFWPFSRGDGETRRYGLRAQPHFECQRRRAHRVAVVLRVRGRQNLFPSECQDRYGGGSNHGHHADRPPPDAAWDVSRQHTEV